MRSRIGGTIKEDGTGGDLETGTAKAAVSVEH